MSQTIAHEVRSRLEQRVTIVNSAIATLIYQDQTYLEHGISFDALVSAASAQGTKYSRKQLEGIVNKELESGSLYKLKNGNLALGPRPADHDGDSSDSFKFEYSVDFSNTKMTWSANSTCISSPQMSVGKRPKIAKKIFDPSDYQMGRKSKSKPSENNVLPSKRKQGRPVGSLNKRTIKRLRIKMTKMGFDLSDKKVPSKRKRGRRSAIKKRVISAELQKYNLELAKKAINSNISTTEIQSEESLLIC